MPTVSYSTAPRIKVSASRGRLYVSGPDAVIAKKVEGATFNPNAHAYEISLTLESLRALRKITKASFDQFSTCCTENVLAWSRAAAASEKKVAEIHATLATGWRETFPWTDNRRDTPVGTARYEASDVYTDDAGVLRWHYRAPFAHQEILSSVAAHLDGTAFICEQGTSKTRAAIEALRYKMERNEVDIAVVICPRGPMGTWDREVAQWSNGMMTVRLDMQVKERRRIIESYIKATPKGGKLVLILNYDVLYLLVDDLIALAKKRRLGVLLDEMHKCANPQAKVTKAAMKLTQFAQWRVGLTGTPIRKDIADIWSQWYLIDLGVTFGANFVQYRHEFMVQNPFNVFEITAKDGAEDEVGLRMRRRGMRYTKDECFDLPPKVYEKLEVDLSAEQQRAYKQMQEYLFTRIREAEDGNDMRVASAANQLVMMMRLSQITSGHLKDEEGKIYLFPKNPKLDALEEAVRDTIAQQQQIVWAIYRPDVDAIAERLADLKPRIIDGRQTGAKGQRERDDIERGFLAGEFPLIVANQKAGGPGLNLQSASMAHYYSQRESFIDRLQSEDRCHRAGSQMHKSITYVDYTVKGTVDEIIVAAIAGKKEVSDIVVDLRRHIGLEG